jgi:hypothetical protein
MPAPSHPNGRSVLGNFDFLLADITSFGVVGYLAEHLWYKTHFLPLGWGIAVLAWVAVWVGGSRWSAAQRGGWVGRGLRVSLLLGSVVVSAAVISALAAPWSWRQAGAFGSMVVSVLFVNRAFLGLVGKRGPRDRWEGLRFAVAQWVGLYAAHSYARSTLLGGGDAQSYSMMVGDFVAQLHAGIFPVFVHQSVFGINGGFHLIRNAPYLQYFAGIIALVTGGTLNIFAILNLTVVASAMGAVVGCYAALRLFMVKAPWASLGLAVLYGLCPGVLAPLFGGDMYPTFMTLPYFPWLVLGIAESVVLPGRFWPWCLQAAALAAIWYGHPPVAGWATLCALMAGGWTLLQERRWRVFTRMLVALSLFIALSGYLFYSVHSLRLPASDRAEVQRALELSLGRLRDCWARTFAPVSSQGDHMTTDLQLGYGLWACVLLAVAAAIRQREGRVLLACLALILVYTWPIPFLSAHAWRALPSQIILVNPWPNERLYVSFAILSAFVAAILFRDLAIRHVWQRRTLGGLLLFGCLWSAFEARKFNLRGSMVAHREEESEYLALPQGIVLSRTHSYEYVGTPDYVSLGHMDPRLETRLIEPGTGRPFADGSTLRPGLRIAPQKPLIVTLGALGSWGETPSFILQPGESRILRFDFMGGQPEGEFQVYQKNGDIVSFYNLPQSGGRLAFGATAEAGKSLIIENDFGTPDDVTFRFFTQAPQTVGPVFARISVEPLEAELRSIRLVSLMPFTAVVSADRRCCLETPKLFINGYRALVDGVDTPCTRSREGLLQVALSPGEHEVVITYPGWPMLRAIFFGSAFAWILLLAAVAAYAFGACPSPAEASGPEVRRP